MWFRLAKRFGMPVSVLQQSMDAREFAEWLAYDKMDPIGDERQEYMLAQIPYIFALVNAGKKGRKIKLSDFLPKHGPKRRASNKDLAGKFRAFAGMFNKTSGAGQDRKVP